MDGQSIPLTMSRVKQQAQTLRQELSADGISITHSRALECLARMNQFKDWNTFRAKLHHDKPRRKLAAGMRVSASYLGRAVSGKLLDVTPYGTQGFNRIVLELDAPVDVAASEHFSAMRHRISAEISPEGRTIETTSDGQPQLVILK